MAEKSELNEIKLYVKNGNSDYFYDNLAEKHDIVFWIDHRDYDEDIINNAENYLKTNFLKGEVVKETNDVIGFEIIIHYKDKKHKIKYKGEGSDRDTTIITLNDVLKPDYEIRLFKASLGGDTLAFLPLSAKQWQELEKEYGKEKMDLLFDKISNKSKMFELYDDVYSKFRKKYNNCSDEILEKIIDGQLTLIEKKETFKGKNAKEITQIINKIRQEWNEAFYNLSYKKYKEKYIK